MKPCLSLALWALSSFHQAAAEWDDPEVDAFVNSIKTVDYNSLPRPDFSNSEVFDGALEQWKEKNQRYTSSMPSRCPKYCSDVGPDPSKWSVYADVERLKACNETLVFDLNVFNKLQDSLTKTNIRVCTADFAKGSKSKRDEEASPEDPAVYEERISSSVHLVTEGSTDDSKAAESLMYATQQVSNYIDNKPAVNGSRPTIAFGSSGSVLMTLYTGHQVRQQGVHEELLKSFIKQIEENGASASILVELCDSNAERGADYTVGIAASTKGDITFIQDAAAKWANGSCVAEIQSNARVRPFAEIELDVPGSAANSSTTSTKAKRTRHQSQVNKRQGRYCTTRQVVSGDSCGSLASKCGISGPKFEEYNNYDKALCSSLTPGQHVCCSEGELPDFRPKPGDDGTCFVYTTKPDDTCSKLAAANSLKASDIDDFNKKTWNFSGCNSKSGLWIGIKICLSEGDPPMPNEVAEATCGPAVPGTKKPEPGTDLSDLNPCPLNACCNIWGNCGVTAEFCTESESESGAPGTAAYGENGCISNCGVQIVKSDPPKEIIRIGYFEAWNGERPCLNMNADHIDTSQYTHIHFAFPDVTEDFRIDISKIEDEFERFKKLEGVKKIVSLGGWAFSNDAPTFQILRNAVQLNNQPIFRQNIIDFVEEHGLDGIDIDWEYPAATDIPGTPPGSKIEGDLLAIFMNMLKVKMPEGKSVSFAAPASYWYLRSYPIDIMAPFVDYIVHMTYDLHGQWDYDNAFTSPGCPTGNCLRSHINLTETFTALSMITKAGMPSNKVAVGVTSYGRSFKIAEKGCYTEMCLFTGSRLVSNAEPGVCTDTAGYISNAEIAVLRENHLTHVKNDLMADTIVFKETEYVSYMTEETKSRRKILYNFYNMGGTSDWAIDLQSFDGDASYGTDLENWQPLEKCEGSYDSVDAVNKDKDNMPDHCIEGYIVGALGKMLENSLDKYDEIMEDGYDTKFGYFANAVRRQWGASMGKFFNNHIDEYFNCYRNTKDGREPHACPPFDRSPGLLVTIVLEPKDEEKLKKFIAEEYDIDWENIEYVTRTDSNDNSGIGCGSGPCQMYYMKGVPAVKRNADVPNPKDGVSEALTNLRKFPKLLKDTATRLRIHSLDAGSTPEDVVDAAMIPVFMTISATEAMDKVADIGEELEEADRKFIIGLIVTAVLFIVPGVGSALTAVTGIAAIARIAAIAAEVGGAVYGAIDIAENPDNAIVDIFGILLGFVGIGSAIKGVWKDAAKLRRGLRATDLKNLGPTVKNNVDLIDSMIKVCRLKK